MNLNKIPFEKAQPGAPALEKGLDLLEALVNEPQGLSQKSLTEQLDRSVRDALNNPLPIGVASR